MTWTILRENYRDLLIKFVYAFDFLTDTTIKISQNLIPYFSPGVVN